MLLEQAGETNHGGFALARCQARPDAGIERGTGVFDRTLGVGDVTAGDLAQQTAIDRAEAIEGFAGHRIGVLAVDEGAAFDLQVAGALFPVGTSQGGHACVLLLLSTNAARCAALQKNSARPACFRRSFRHRAPATLNQRLVMFQYI
ncbi:hypothetical protein D3C80_1707440 [compost metagenome]